MRKPSVTAPVSSRAAINDCWNKIGVRGDFSCPASPDPRQWLCVSRESFHPNNTGTDRYSLIFSAALAAANY